MNFLTRLTRGVTRTAETSARIFTRASYRYSWRTVSSLGNGMEFRRPLLQEADTQSYFGVLVNVRCQGTPGNYNFQLRILDTTGIGHEAMTNLTCNIAVLLTSKGLIDQGMSVDEATDLVYVRVLSTAYRQANRMARAAFSHYLTSEEALVWRDNLERSLYAEYYENADDCTSLPA